jgi:hypothetical protein
MKKSPTSKAICLFCFSSLGPLGSSDADTSMTPMPPVGFTDRTRLFSVMLACYVGR